jgi:CheY-like chemotaxis protein
MDHRGNGQPIPVVDDVAEQREIATAMLGKLGYRAEAVSSGEAAVEHVTRRPVDLLLLDMVNDPGVDRLETYKRIIEIHPAIKIHQVIGFSHQPIAEAMVLMPSAKPDSTFPRKAFQSAPNR